VVRNHFEYDDCPHIDSCTYWLLIIEEYILTNPYYNLRMAVDEFTILLITIIVTENTARNQAMAGELDLL
jgi:hypothetical protein